MMRTIAAPAALLFTGLSVALLASACGLADAARPPVELSSRESLLGAGQIVAIKNTSNETLEGVKVVIRAPDGEERSFTREEPLGGYEEFEIGWRKLGGWEIPPGAAVEISAKGFVMPAERKVVVTPKAGP